MITQIYLYRNTITIVVLMMVTMVVVGQKSISLTDAKTLAKTENQDLKSQRLNVQYHTANVNTAYTMDPTLLETESGQFNSAFFDLGVGISQSFHLPKVYHQRKNINEQKVRIAESYAQNATADVDRRLSEVFTDYNYLAAKENILYRQDSLYSIFLRTATARYQNGESDVLAKISAEQQKLSISNALIAVQGQKEMLLVEFNWLLGNRDNFVPEVADFATLPLPILYDSASINKHPILVVAQQENLASQMATQIEKSAKMPKFTVGYRNLSIRGTGADNVDYNFGDRFHSIQLGIAMPLLNKGNNAAIQSAKIMEDVTAQQYIAKKVEIESRLKQKSALYQSMYERAKLFESTSLPNAIRMQSTAEKQFASGEINYLEFVLLTQQALSIENEYLQIVYDLRLLDVDLKYLTSNL